MRRSNKRLLKLVVAALAKGNGGPSTSYTGPMYTTAPADLAAADEELRRREQEWREAGAVRVTEPQVNQALERAKALQSEFNQIRARGRPGIALMYLKLVRLFFLTPLPGYGKAIVIGGAAALVCAFSLLVSPFVCRSLGAAFEFALVLAVTGSSLATAAVFLLWPTEPKRQAFQRLQRQCKEQRALAESMRPGVTQGWEDYRGLRRSLTLCNRLDQARMKHEELAALLASEKYQLIHADWRSMRDKDFENFLSRIFQTLGYQVQLTKASGDQGADLLVTGKGSKVAVQAKGYAYSVGNIAVQAAVASMAFYGCDSCAAITNSRFTRAAIQLAQANGCRLIEGAQIPDLIEGLIY